MSDDQLFRLILLAKFLILTPFGVYHRHKSHTPEPLDRWQEGMFILVTLRLAGIVGMLGLVAYLINPVWMAWSAWRLPVTWRWVGVAFALMAGGLFVWTFRSLGKNLTDTVVTRKGSYLVTHGPYRWVRHPYYDVVVLAMVGNTLLTANWFFLASGIIIFGLLAVRTRKEEENLIARFGDEYRAYMKRTGRFFPRL